MASSSQRFTAAKHPDNRSQQSSQPAADSMAPPIPASTRYREQVRVLVAPDKFRGTLSAEEAASAIERGWLRGRPGDHVEAVPLADGGEGTLDVLVDAFDGWRHSVLVHGPLGNPIDAEYGLVPRGQGVVAVVEMSRASGVALVPDGREDVVGATTFGTGELLSAAAEETSEIIACIGGSATNDGGAGMAQAVGFRLLNQDGRDIGLGGGAVLDLTAIDTRHVNPAVRAAHILVASDVDNPLIGPNGASKVYGPQKGAKPEEVGLLDRALARLADTIERDLGVDVRDLPGAGAAGGLGAGLVGFLGAELRAGVDIVMHAVSFDDRLAEADLVITGEGKLDAQSWHGKVGAGVIARAGRARRDWLILCGRSEGAAADLHVESLVTRFGEERAMRDAKRALEDLATLVAEAGPACAPSTGDEH